MNVEQPSVVNDALWVQVWAGCRRRIRGWRVPPHWTMTQWLEELEAEGRVAALQALGDFDPSRNIPLAIYLRMRVLGRAIGRYRKEWTYAIHQSSRDVLESEAKCEPNPDGSSEELGAALARLDESDRRLIKRIFWGDESESDVARSLGISQQAVNKRKHVIMRRLRRILGG